MKDDPAFADAIDCMVSYFYNAGYTASKYGTPESSLHAQVAIIADKYDCATLYKLAKIAFGDTVKTVEGDDWVAIAELIYDYTTTEAPAHADLRNSVIPAVAARPAVLQKTLQSERAVEVLRSNADLATDLLRFRVRGPSVNEQDDAKGISWCPHCFYAHMGSPTCSNVASSTMTTPFTFGQSRFCGQCGRSGINSVTVASQCSSCNGMHSKRP